MADFDEIMKEHLEKPTDFSNVMATTPAKAGDFDEVMQTAPQLGKVTAPADLDASKTAGIQSLRGTPVGKGMPTGPEQLGSPEPTKGLTDIATTAGDFGNVMASMLAGGLQPIAETVARPFTGKEGIEKIRGAAAKVQPTTPVGQAALEGVSYPFTKLSEGAQYLLKKAGVSPEQAEELTTGAMAGTVLGGLMKGPLLKRTGASLAKQLNPEQMLAEQGLEPKGVTNINGKEPLYFFNDPKTGSTLALPKSKLTPEGIAEHVAKSREAFGVGEKVSDPIPALQKSLQAVEADTSALAASHVAPDEPTTIKGEGGGALGRWLAKEQTTGIKLERNIKEGWKGISDDEKVAITNYREAVANLSETMPYGRKPQPEEISEYLMRRANTTADPGLKEGYIKAANLSPQGKEIARVLDEHYEAQWQKANEAGVVDGWVAGYANHIYKSDPGFARQLLAEVNAGALRVNPSLAKRRIFSSYYEAEQSGKVPLNKSADFLQVAYDQALNKAIAARTFVKEMFNSTEKDGRPTLTVFAKGDPVEGPQGKATLINPRRFTDETGDYIPYNHPAFKQWVWAQKDTAGNPIFVKGDVLVHPDAIKKMRALFDTSKIRQASFEIKGHEVKYGEAAMNFSNNVKGTVLVGPFHQVHTMTHDMYHGNNPFRAPEINLEHPDVQLGLRNGLMIYNDDALGMFGEGLTSGGFWKYVPKVGEGLQRYGEYVFKDLIPRMKVQMFLKALQDNRSKFSQSSLGGFRKALTEDQVAELTAKQANAAFGEQNYRWLFKSQTWQDAMRLLMLAPDFLISRIKFVAQAATPYGMEQRKALLRAAVGLYGAARVLNTAFSDDHDPHWDKPFSVLIDGREWTLRSVLGDTYHLFADPHSFVWHRLNPVTTRPMIEWFSGVDQFGRRRDWTGQLKDLFGSWTPIPTKGFFGDTRDEGRMMKIFENLMASFGVTSWQSRTPAEQKAADIYWSKLPSGIEPRIKDKLDFIRDAEEKASAGVPIADLMSQARQRGIQMEPQELIKVMINGKQPRFDRHFNRLDAEDAIVVWEKMSPIEKDHFRLHILRKIISSKILTPERRAQMMQKIGGN